MFLENTHQMMLPQGGERLLWRLVEGKLCRWCAAQDMPISNRQLFGDMEKLHFKGISYQKPGSKVISQLISVPWIQLLVTKDRFDSL